ncbi:MAG TPA: acylphosphatase [Steroidobacteraceae bacterium]|jgi:acylphosphatase|nr:acylphosphatase [Steroidobacteraceae bacterium]
MDSRPSPAAARCAVVRGRVQGVWFRASTAERAGALGLCGCAENRPDGSVLVHAAGDPAALDALVEWLHRGPPMARVDSVEVASIEPGSREWPEGFLQR